MNRYQFFRSTSDPTESATGERARHAELVQASDTVYVEVGPVTDSDDLTETEWSAFMGLP